MRLKLNTPKSEIVSFDRVVRRPSSVNETSSLIVNIVSIRDNNQRVPSEVVGNLGVPLDHKRTMVNHISSIASRACHFHLRRRLFVK